MNKLQKNNLITAILAVALSLAAWSSALDLEEFTYQDGDMLEAAAFNTLLNGNFAAVEAEFLLLRSEITSLTTQLATLQAAAPVAFGTILYDGSNYKKSTGTDNWSVTMLPGAGAGIYTAVITITDVAYTTGSYTTIVTPSGEGTANLTPAVAGRVSDSAGNLRVDMVGGNGVNKLAHFQFITFKNP